MKINGLQASAAGKIRPLRKKFTPVCTGYAKSVLTGRKFAGLLHFIEKAKMGKEIEVVLEQPRHSKDLDKWKDNNAATTNAMTRRPVSLTDWRKSKSEWLAAKNALDVFFNGSREQYKKLFTTEEWEARKKIYATKFEKPEELVADDDLLAKFSATQKVANQRMDEQVVAWIAKSPHNASVPNIDVKVHLIEVLTDLLFMKGREQAGREEDKWQVLYEHPLTEQMVYINECAWLLGYNGDNFEHVMIAFDKECKEVFDGIFAEKAEEKEKIDEYVPPHSAPISIAPQPSPPEPAQRTRPKSSRYSPEEPTPEIPGMSAQERAVALFLNSQAGIEVTFESARRPREMRQSFMTMTASIAAMLEQPPLDSSPSPRRQPSPPRSARPQVSDTTGSRRSSIALDLKDSVREHAMPSASLPPVLTDKPFPEKPLSKKEIKKEIKKGRFAVAERDFNSTQPSPVADAIRSGVPFWEVTQDDTIRGFGELQVERQSATVNQPPDLSITPQSRSNGKSELEGMKKSTHSQPSSISQGFGLFKGRRHDSAPVSPSQPPMHPMAMPSQPSSIHQSMLMQSMSHQSLKRSHSTTELMHEYTPGHFNKKVHSHFASASLPLSSKIPEAHHTKVRGATDAKVQDAHANNHVNKNTQQVRR